MLPAFTSVLEELWSGLKCDRIWITDAYFFGRSPEKGLILNIFGASKSYEAGTVEGVAKGVALGASGSLSIGVQLHAFPQEEVRWTPRSKFLTVAPFDASSTFILFGGEGAALGFVIDRLAWEEIAKERDGIKQAFDLIEDSLPNLRVIAVRGWPGSKQAVGVTVWGRQSRSKLKKAIEFLFLSERLNPLNFPQRIGISAGMREGIIL